VQWCEHSPTCSRGRPCRCRSRSGGVWNFAVAHRCRRSGRPWAAACWFALAACTRSVGASTICYILGVAIMVCVCPGTVCALLLLIFQGRPRLLAMCLIDWHRWDLQAPRPFGAEGGRGLKAQLRFWGLVPSLVRCCVVLAPAAVFQLAGWVQGACVLLNNATTMHSPGSLPASLSPAHTHESVCMTWIRLRGGLTRSLCVWHVCVCVSVCVCLACVCVCVCLCVWHVCVWHVCVWHVCTCARRCSIRAPGFACFARTAVPPWAGSLAPCSVTLGTLDCAPLRGVARRDFAWTTNMRTGSRLVWRSRARGRWHPRGMRGRLPGVQAPFSCAPRGAVTTATPSPPPLPLNGAGADRGARPRGVPGPRCTPLCSPSTGAWACFGTFSPSRYSNTHGHMLWRGEGRRGVGGRPCVSPPLVEAGSIGEQWTVWSWCV
jgi:hypothetical protein